MVFLGDSITENWLSDDPALFIPGRVCRGISGQTTPQMLLRFSQDVIDLRPRFVHILAGTNDSAGNTGRATFKMIQDNILGMTETAMANRAKLIFGSITPATNFSWHPGIDALKPIAAVNAWLKVHAQRVRALYVDYFAALSDGDGVMRPGLSPDQVHPKAAGYAAMRLVAEATLHQASQISS